MSVNLRDRAADTLIAWGGGTIPQTGKWARACQAIINGLGAPASSGPSLRENAYRSIIENLGASGLTEPNLQDRAWEAVLQVLGTTGVTATNLSDQAYQAIIANGGLVNPYAGAINTLGISDETSFEFFMDTAPYASAVDLSIYGGLGYSVHIEDASSNVCSALTGAAGSGGSTGSFGPELTDNGDFDGGIAGWSPDGSALLSSDLNGQSGACIKITEHGKFNPYAKDRVSIPHTSILLLAQTYYKAGTQSGFIWGIYGTGYFFTEDKTGTSTWQQSDKHYFNNKNQVNPLITLKISAVSGDGTYGFYDELTVKQITGPSDKGCWTLSGYQPDVGFDYNSVSFDVTIGP